MRKKRDDPPKSPSEQGESASGILTSRLPIRIDDLLHARVVEVERIEFKAGWNPDPILRTLCAFANEFENLGGGYLVIGQDLAEAPVGHSETEQSILEFCKDRPRS